MIVVPLSIAIRRWSALQRMSEESLSRGCYGLRESKMRLCKTLKKMNSSGDWEKAVTNEPNQDDGACVAELDAGRDVRNSSDHKGPQGLPLVV